MSKDTHEADVAFIKALAELLRENDLTELQVKREYGDDDSLNVRVSRALPQAAPIAVSAPAAAPAPAAAAAPRPPLPRPPRKIRPRIPAPWPRRWSARSTCKIGRAHV